MRDEDFLSLSGIQHFVFCRRQWALIHIEQVWQENVLTLEGKFMHERAHDASTEKRGDVIITRGMPVFSNELGINGVCDVVEFHQDEQGVPIHGRNGTFRVVPIEYKRGREKQNDADILQLCAQAMCLEEMLACTVSEGYLFYGETKRRTSVMVTDERRTTVRTIFREMHGYYDRGHTPTVKPHRACKNCSLADLCLPMLMKGVSAVRYMAKMIEESNE